MMPLESTAPVAAMGEGSFPCSCKPKLVCFSSNTITTIPSRMSAKIQLNWLYSTRPPNTHTQCADFPWVSGSPLLHAQVHLSVLLASTYASVWVDVYMYSVHIPILLEDHVNFVKQLSHSNMLHSKGNKIIRKTSCLNLTPWTGQE